VHPEQVQIFTPTPLTYASVMYYTEKDPFTGNKLFVEKNLHRKSMQKQMITGNLESRKSGQQITNKNRIPSPRSGIGKNHA